MNKFLLYFGMIMVAFYIFAGGYLLFIEDNVFQLPFKYRISAGILLILYGAFRMYRYFQLAKQNENKQ